MATIYIVSAWDCETGEVFYDCEFSSRVEADADAEHIRGLSSRPDWLDVGVSERTDDLRRICPVYMSERMRMILYKGEVTL